MSPSEPAPGAVIGFCTCVSAPVLLNLPSAPAAAPNPVKVALSQEQLEVGGGGVEGGGGLAAPLQSVIILSVVVLIGAALRRALLEVSDQLVSVRHQSAVDQLPH